jgi:hypothetical protein
VKNLGPATRHKEATVNSTSRELSSKAKAQNVFGIFGSKYIFWQNWTFDERWWWCGFSGGRRWLPDYHNQDGVAP